MHEFSIATGIAEVALEAAEQHGLTTVSAVEVNIGDAAGVVTDALDFAWESVRKGGLLDTAQLKINRIPLVMRCSDCGTEYQAAEVWDPCPSCGSLAHTVISGRELKVISIES
jgi:hydrogenase nickel incorporation protein HypA/HybF